VSEPYISADVSDVLPDVRCPVLLFDHRGFPINLNTAADLAIVSHGLPDSHVIVRDTPSYTPFMDDLDECVAAIRTFFDSPTEQRSASKKAVLVPPIPSQETPCPESCPQANAALVVHHNGSSGKRVPLSGTSLLLGRNSDNDLVLESPQISRYHARVTWNTSGFLIEDLGSKNGTRLNGVRIGGPAALRDGDTIDVGDFIIAFQTDATETVSLTSDLAPASD
jgi:hypothetical protein